MAKKISISSRVLTALAPLVIGVCCILPMGWIVYQLGANPTVLSELRVDRFRAELIGRTLLYNGSVALVATLLALPAAVVLGRGRGVMARLLWIVLPISLLMPSITFAYGWKQLVRLMGWEFDIAGPADVARCVWTLACWLWPLSAGLVGWSLRQLDTQVQQQALLDGVLWRVTFRQLLGPILAGAAMMLVLAVQEFAVYEPTGISVVATEVRQVFETGAFSSPDNPITQPLGGGSGFIGISLPDQRARAAAAVATSLPLLALIGASAAFVWSVVRNSSAADAIDTGIWPRSLDAGVGWSISAWSIVAITLGTPLVSLILSYRTPRPIADVVNEFGPQLLGSLLISGLTFIAAALLAMLSTLRPSKLLMILAMLSFLIGGQLVAIALIRLYNRHGLFWVYNGPTIVVMAYIARFGWIALAAAGVVWSTGWKSLRDSANVDGASPLQFARSIVIPLAWPLLIGAALLVAILSLSEVPATVLISPQRPQTLVPMMMSWVHMLRYDAMIEASLLITGMVAAMGVVAMAFIWLGKKIILPHRHRATEKR